MSDASDTASATEVTTEPGELLAAELQLATVLATLGAELQPAIVTLEPAPAAASSNEHGEPSQS